MSILILAALTAATATLPVTHKVTIQQQGAPVDLEYRAKVSTSTRQIGMAPPARPSTQICNWTTTVAVERHGAAGSAQVGETKEIRGSQAGVCAAARPAINQQIAARQDDVRAHVVAAAEADRTQLLATVGTPLPGAN